MENQSKIKRTAPIPTIELEGGKYVMVHERIKFIADNFVHEIDTSSEFIENLNSWKVKAVLKIHEDGKVLSYSGTAIEKIGSSEVNSSSALENAETSAIGRACAFAGFGIEERIASGDEMEGVEREKPIVVKEKFEASKVKSKTAEEKVLERLNGKNK